MMLCKAFFYRAMAYMNALALFANLLGFIVAELVFDSRTSANQRLSYVYILITTKLVIA